MPKISRAWKLIQFKAIHHSPLTLQTKKSPTRSWKSNFQVEIGLLSLVNIDEASLFPNTLIIVVVVLIIIT